ncbi:MAG: glycosyltransferase [Streptococcus thermophilus]
MTKISVLTTIYNETFFQVKRAIQSVKSQSGQNFVVEHVIVIDNPQYKDMKQLSKLSNALNSRNFYTNIVQNERNLGLSQSLNKAIEISSSDILARLDSDDWMSHGRLCTQYQSLITMNADIVYTDTLLSRVDRRENEYVSALGADKINKLLPLKNFISHSSVMFLKPAVISVGKYRKLEPAEDYDLWLRLKNAGKKFAYVSEPLTIREIRSDSISNSNLYYQIKMAKFVRKLNKHHEKNLQDVMKIPQNLKNRHKLEKINKKISAFRASEGLKKLCLGLSSVFIIRTSLNDVYFKCVLINMNLKNKLKTGKSPNYF